MASQETIDRIAQFDADGLPVVSVYVNVEPDNSARTRISSLLDQIRPQAKNHSLNHDARLSLRGDLENMAGAVANQRRPPGMTAFFSCSGKDFFEDVTLPRALRDRAIVDSAPLVRPMQAVLEEYHRMGVVVVDDAAAQVFNMYLDEIHPVQQLRDPALRKTDFAAGKLEHRVHNKVDELAKRHYRRVASMLDDMFHAQHFDLLAVGGQPEGVSMVTEFLPPQPRERMAGTFTIDAATATPADLRRRAECIMERYEREQESRLVAEIAEGVAERRRAALGVESCLWAGTVAAIERLAIQQDATMPGVVCDRSGWLALSGDTCPLCGEPTRPTPDVLDELVETVVAQGGSVRHVEADTDLHRHVVGALLRFPLPPKPPT